MNIRKLPADLFARRLIQAGRADAMSAESRRRIFTGLGVPVSPPLSAELGQVTKVTATKGLLVGVGAMGAVGALSIWAAVHAWQPSAAVYQVVEASPVPAAAAVVVKDEQSPELNEVTKPEVTNPELTDSRNAVASGSSKIARTPARGAAEPVTKDSLNRELTKVDSARDAVLRGEPAAALRMLDQYSAEFPSGALRTEAQVLRIEALAARGERGQVTRLGGAFLAQQPNGAYARRVRALMGASVPVRQKQ